MPTYQQLVPRPYVDRRVASANRVHHSVFPLLVEGGLAAAGLEECQQAAARSRRLEACYHRSFAFNDQFVSRFEILNRFPQFRGQLVQLQRYLSHPVILPPLTAPQLASVEPAHLARRKLFLEDLAARFDREDSAAGEVVADLDATADLALEEPGVRQAG